jgi:hypothetical protein
VQEGGLSTDGGAKPQRDMFSGDLVAQTPEADEHLAQGKARARHIEHWSRHGLQEISNRATHEQAFQERAAQRPKDRKSIDFM